MSHGVTAALRDSSDGEGICLRPAFWVTVFLAPSFFKAQTFWCLHLKVTAALRDRTMGEGSAFDIITVPARGFLLLALSLFLTDDGCGGSQPKHGFARVLGSHVVANTMLLTLERQLLGVSILKVYKKACRMTRVRSSVNAGR